ncbi:MAG: putative anti-sigma regulatory factor, serine/threonine protein kinase [Streptosporangiaceae bacterium]|jgi:anti-sigma regulatory factor (Ser/Thr protein kinase)|nr:putative anti-sigma regulatory factor, serine/threonine protein kinase [Streptosporangiaceae bacterium]
MGSSRHHDHADPPADLREAVKALARDHGPAISFTVAPEPESVTYARHFTATTLRRWDMCALTDDVGLVVTELVTNALRHSLPPRPAEPAGAIRLRLIREATYLLCGIQDAGENLPRRREPDYVAETGRGLHIVESFSSMWGWARCTEGKVVWALFRIPGPSAS